MNQPFTMMREMSIGEYLSAVEGWGIANYMPPTDDHLAPPSPEWWEGQQVHITENPHLTH